MQVRNETWARRAFAIAAVFLIVAGSLLVAIAVVAVPGRAVYAVVSYTRLDATTDALNASIAMIPALLTALLPVIITLMIFSMIFNMLGGLFGGMSFGSGGGNRTAKRYR